jgi:hypothetical protein
MNLNQTCSNTSLKSNNLFNNFLRNKNLVFALKSHYFSLHNKNVNVKVIRYILQVVDVSIGRVSSVAC